MARPIFRDPAALEQLRAQFAARAGVSPSLEAITQETQDSVDNVASTIAFKPSPTTPKGINTLEKGAVEKVIAKESNKITVKLLKHRKTDAGLPRTLEQCWLEATEQLEPYQTELLKTYRLAIAVRALALYQNPHVSNRRAQLTAFMPANILALWLDISESYLWQLQRHERHGAGMFSRLVGQRPWFTSWGRSDALQTVKGGSVWTTRATPLAEGFTARVPLEDVKQPWRDLQADVKASRTFAAITATTGKIRRRGLSSGSKYPEEKGSVELNEILHFSLNRFSTDESGVKRDTELTRTEETYAVLDALSGETPNGHDARAEWVDRLANQICYALADSRSLDGWRHALWVGLKARAYGMGEALEVIGGAIWEAAIRSGDNPRLRSRGALARSLMNLNGWQGFCEAVAGLKIGPKVSA